MTEESSDRRSSEDYLFNIGILHDTQSNHRLPKLPKGYRLRPLHINDCNNGYLELLKNDEKQYMVDIKDFIKRFEWMSASKPLPYYTVVVEDCKGHIAAAVTLIIEYKFIHGLGARSRIKDLAVGSEHRGRGIGRLLNLYMCKLAIQLGTYKVSLSCSDELVSFFQSCGFVKDPGNNVMCCELKEEKKDSNGLKSDKNFLGEAFFKSCLDEEMFSRFLLKAVNLHGAPTLPEKFCVRPLCESDWECGFLSLLEQLTVVGKISESDFIKRFRLLQDLALSKYFVLVLEDVEKQRIMGTGTLFVDMHSSFWYGHIEDIVVDASLRGKKLGQFLNICLLELARQIGVYHISLECKDRLVTFYEQFGYVRNGNFMVCRFDK